MDATLLSTVADRVVLVVNSRETPKYVVKEARSRPTYVQVNVLGVVPNRVNMRSGGSAYYYGHYYSYYRHTGEEEVN